MGNDGECKIVGIGNVCLLTSIGCRLMLKDVHHVPDVRLNLISTGWLDYEGYSCCLLAGLATTQVSFRTLLQRGGKVRMLDHTRKIKIISIDGKKIQMQGYRISAQV